MVGFLTPRARNAIRQRERSKYASVQALTPLMDSIVGDTGPPELRAITTSNRSLVGLAASGVGTLVIGAMYSAQGTFTWATLPEVLSPSILTRCSGCTKHSDPAAVQEASPGFPALDQVLLARAWVSRRRAGDMSSAANCTSRIEKASVCARAETRAVVNCSSVSTRKPAPQPSTSGRRL